MQQDSKGRLVHQYLDPAGTAHGLQPIAQGRTKSFDVLLDKTEAFIQPNTSSSLSSFVSSQVHLFIYIYVIILIYLTFPL